MTTVHEAILSAIQEVGVITREQPVFTDEGRAYRVVGIDHITTTMQPILVASGLTILPQVREYKSWDTEKVEGGVLVRATHFASVLVDYTITGPENDSVVVTMVGEAESPNDKAMSAALSYAEKYMYKQVFKIMTGDPDPDVVGAHVAAQPISAPAPAPASAPTPAPVAAPAPTPAMSTTIAAAASAPVNTQGQKMASENQIRMIWAITHKTLQPNWDDIQLIKFIAEQTHMDYTGMNWKAVGESLTFDQAKPIINKLKALAGQS